MNEATLPPVDEQLGNEEDTDDTLTSEASTEAPEVDEEELPDTPSEDEESSNSSDDAKSKKPSGIQRRFQKFEHRLNQQAQELEYWKKQAMGTMKPAETQAPVQKPKLADFDSVEEFVEAREEFLRKELLSQVETAAVQKTQQVSAQTAYERKVQAAKTELEDWDEVLEAASDEQTTQETVHFCLESDIGPKIAYYLAKNPEVNDKLNSMSPFRRIAELGKLEDKLATKSPSVPKPTTKAPSKLSEVKGKGNLTVPSVDNPRSYTEWKKADEARKKAARR